MPKRKWLTEVEIRKTADALLRARPRATQTQLRDELKAQFGRAGRTERVGRIFTAVKAKLYPASNLAPLPPDGDTADLRARLYHADARAVTAERQIAELREQLQTIERESQNLWARRYQEKVADLQRRYAAKIILPPGATHEEYLRQHDQIIALKARLAKTETETEDVYENK